MEVKRYILCDCHAVSVDLQVICLSYESIYSYISCLQTDFRSRNITSATVIFDQLLITGNNSNRFLLMEYKDNQFLYSTARNITPDNSVREKTMIEVKKHGNCLENSVLTSRQISMIKRGLIL